MPRNLFSRSSSKQPSSPSRPEPVSSSSPPQEKLRSSPSINNMLSNGDEMSVKSSLPTSEISLPEKQSAWNWISRTLLRKSSKSLERPSTPSTTTGHGVQLQPTHKIEAIEGELVAPRHKIGTASIDCEFYKIEYGQFKGRPACLIIVDVRLVYPPDNTIKGVKLEFQFAKDGEQNLPPGDLDVAQNNKLLISKVFAPEIIEGMPNHTTKTTHRDIKPKIEGLSFKVDTGGGGGQTIATKEHRWRVLGRREEHNGLYDTFGWNIFQNEISEDSVPRQLRLGMIAFHQHQPFCVNVNIEGSTRQKHRRLKAPQEKRWFNPPNPEDVGHHILQEPMVETLVSRQNLLIRDIAPSRVMEGKTVNPIDVAEISGAAATGIDGGGLITDLLSGGDTAWIAANSTTVTGSDSFM